MDGIKIEKLHRRSMAFMSLDDCWKSNQGVSNLENSYCSSKWLCRHEGTKKMLNTLLAYTLKLVQETSGQVLYPLISLDFCNQCFDICECLRWRENIISRGGKMATRACKLWRERAWRAGGRFINRIKIKSVLNTSHHLNKVNMQRVWNLNWKHFLLVLFT